MAKTDSNSLVSDALQLSDDVDNSLNKAKAIIWLMANQGRAEVMNDDAMTWAGIAARELVDKAMAAVQTNFEKAKATA